MAKTRGKPYSSIFFSVCLQRMNLKTTESYRSSRRESSGTIKEGKPMRFLKWLHCFVATGKQRTIRGSVCTAWEVAGCGSEHAIRGCQHQGVASPNQLVSNPPISASSLWRSEARSPPLFTFLKSSYSSPLSLQ